MERVLWVKELDPVDAVEAVQQVKGITITPDRDAAMVPAKVLKLAGVP